MPEGNVIQGKFGNLQLSAGIVNKFQKETRKLEGMLQEKGFNDIQDWLDSDDFIGSREDALQQELAEWGLLDLSSTEGYAWFLQKYF